MKIRFIALLLILPITCSTKSNFITMMSADDSQEVSWVAEKAGIFLGFEIDTLSFIQNFGNFCFSEENYSRFMRKSESGNKYVFLIEKEFKYHKEGELYISLFGQVDNSNLCELYLLEIGTYPYLWQLVDGNVRINDIENNSYLFVEATLKSVGFALSEIIRFPLNSSGGYDDIQRFIKVKSQTELSESAYVGLH